MKCMWFAMKDEFVVSGSGSTRMTEGSISRNYNTGINTRDLFWLALWHQVTNRVSLTCSTLFYRHKISLAFLSILPFIMHLQGTLHFPLILMWSLRSYWFLVRIIFSQGININWYEWMGVTNHLPSKVVCIIICDAGPGACDIPV